MSSKWIIRFICKQFLISLFCTSIGYCLNYCDSDISSCKFLNSETDPRPKNYERLIKNIDEKSALLDKINSRRNKIASGDVRSLASAEAMIKLEWNEELEKSAQRWADQCVGQHNMKDVIDPCRDLDKIQVGQNIATVYGDAPGLSPLSLVDVWYTELLNINVSVILRYTASSDLGLSHYDYFTQLVWDHSTEVGCGGVKFQERQDTNGNTTKTVNRLVCNFAPSGNILGESVYTAGPPCSRCPYHSVCDLKYKALCNLKHNRTKLDKENYSIKVVTNAMYIDDIPKSASQNTGNTETITEDENYTFDYISHLFDLTRQDITVLSTQSSSICNNKLDVDEFIELLKKRLRNDSLLKELFSSTKGLQNGNEYNISDSNVAMFVSKIYSKKEPTTTTKLPESEYVNSTLLVNLVEAVIFRSGERTISTEPPEDIKQSVIDVAPVKIQAELPEVKQNHDFTGHYFFPEDSTEESNTETLYAYDDATSISVSDIVLEIESMKRDKTTKDFVEDIIDDAMTEISRKKRNNYVPKENDFGFPDDIDKLNSIKIGISPCSEFHDNILSSYCDLLNKLAIDLEALKLNERFHCSKNCSNQVFVHKLYFFTILIIIKLH